MDFSTLKNTNIASQLRPDEIYLRATKSYCDCNTTLGSTCADLDLKELRFEQLFQIVWDRIDPELKIKYYFGQHDKPNPARNTKVA